MNLNSNVFRVSTLLTFVPLLGFAASADGAKPQKPDNAQEVEFHKKRLSDIQRKLQEQMKLHEAASVRERSLLGELEKMGARMDAVKKDLRDTKRKIEKVTGEIRRAERELKAALTELRGTNRRLGAVVRAWYLSAVATPLSQWTEPVDASVADVAFRALAGSEAGDVERLTATSERVTEKKLSLEKVRKSEQKLKAREQERLAALGKEKKSRDQWLGDVRHEKAAVHAALSELRDAQKQMENLLALLQKELRAAPDSTGEGRELTDAKGSLPWPVPGKVVESFGSHQHPLFRVNVVHQGVTIKTEEGAAVKAVSEGRVAFADTIKGYGQVVIVQHGDQMYTLYGQLGQIDVTAGEQVRPGSIVGYVGEGLRGEPTMYFEVRKGGKALDPMDWLRRKP